MNVQIIKPDQIPQIIKQLQNKRMVLVGGGFDLLHIGHLTFLEKAKEQGDFLVVLLESDTKLKEKKGDDRPIHDQASRAKILSSLRFVDLVVLLPFIKENQEYDLIIEQIKPMVIATTEGDREIEYKKRSAKLVGAKVVEVTPFIPEYSTTKLLKVLSE